MNDHNNMLPRNKAITRVTSGSLEKKILEKKIGLKKYLTGGMDKEDFNDAI